MIASSLSAHAKTRPPILLITETSPCSLGNLRKDILYNCLKNLPLFVEKINIKFLEINVK